MQHPQDRKNASDDAFQAPHNIEKYSTAYSKRPFLRPPRATDEPAIFASVAHHRASLSRRMSKATKIIDATSRATIRSNICANGGTILNWVTAEMARN